MSRDEALEALKQTDWTDAEVVREPRTASVVHSVRLPNPLSERVEAEATRRGITPSALIRQLIENGLFPIDNQATITVRVADLHRAIENVVREAA